MFSWHKQCKTSLSVVSSEPHPCPSGEVREQDPFVQFGGKALATDAHANIFIAGGLQGKIFKVDTASGTVLLLAGSGLHGFVNPEPAG